MSRVSSQVSFRPTAILIACGLAATAVQANRPTFFIEPEVVYFEFMERDFEYAARDDELEIVEFDGEVSWRLGLGLRWEGGWDLTVRYLTLDRCEKPGSVKLGDEDKGDGLFSTSLMDAEGVGFDSVGLAKAQLDLDYQVFDLELGKRIDWDRAWFRVFGGARLTWFDQDAQVVYVVGDMGYKSSTYLDWRGYGVRAGGEGHINLGSDTGWSFFGRAALSAISGRHNTNHREEDLGDGSGKPDEILFLEDDFTEISMGLDMALGFEYARELDASTISVAFGWELQDWSDVPSPEDVIQDFRDDRGVQGEGFGLDGFFLRVGWAW